MVTLNPKPLLSSVALAARTDNKQTNKNLRCGNRKGLLGRNDQTHHRMGPKTMESIPPSKRNTQADIQLRTNNATSSPKRARKGLKSYMKVKQLHSCKQQQHQAAGCKRKSGNNNSDTPIPCYIHILIAEAAEAAGALGTCVKFQAMKTIAP